MYVATVSKSRNTIPLLLSENGAAFSVGAPRTNNNNNEQCVLAAR